MEVNILLIYLFVQYKEIDPAEFNFNVTKSQNNKLGLGDWFLPPFRKLHNACIKGVLNCNKGGNVGPQQLMEQDNCSQPVMLKTEVL